jgi:formylglycine-generating enzyme required for sulfatase activity
MKYCMNTLLCMLILQSCHLEPSPDKWINSVDRMVFTKIPAGVFNVGVPADSFNTRMDTLTFAQGFWMAEKEVTVEQFRHFVQMTGYITRAELDSHRFTWNHPGFIQNADHPVVWLAFQDALAYADWAGVSLPTQAEWLYACRAGTTSRFFWGDSLNNQYVWHRANSGDGTRSTGSKLANPWGLYDMVGNAWEYTIVCDERWAAMGGSWTRCPQYMTRQGYIAEVLAETVAPKLTRCEPYEAYPYDDDRGFRCIRRF